MAAGDWNGSKRAVRFSFGNTHAMVPTPNNLKKDLLNTKITNRWCMFVKLDNDEKESGRYIEQITYHLHPTYRINKIVIKEGPFLLSRLAWGYFDITMHIKFKAWTGLGTRELVHELSFTRGGKTESMFAEIDEDKPLHKQR